MKIGVPREIKDNENRVAMTPAGVHLLVGEGHDVLVEAGAGWGSGIVDEEYAGAGATLVAEHAAAFDAEIVVKVKEPLAPEYPLCREGQTIFTYFHFAASRELTDAMLQSGATCIAYETVRDEDGSLPLLTPMSEVAGRMAIQEGAKYLEKPMMGRGILLGGVPGVEPGNVLILGGGVVGASAARAAAGLGANVTILDVNLTRLRYLDEIMPPNVHTLYSTPYTVREKAIEADLLIGAVLVPGAKAPRLVRRELLKEMKNGSVIVDVAVDQGGCIETCRPTTHSNPTFVVEGVVHYCVTNMPGAVGRTSTYALTNATLKYVQLLAARGPEAAIREISALAQGANVINGKITHPAVAEAFSLPYEPPTRVVGWR
jgi:alanine dehydrogenase